MKFLNAIASHPLSVLMIYLGLMIFGFTSLGRLNIELLPTINIPIAYVITEYPDIPAEEVEELVTVQLENALSSVKGVKSMKSMSKEGISSVSLEFGWDSDIDIAAVEIREKIDTVFPYLPHGISKPIVYTEDLADEPVITLAVFPAREGAQVKDISEIVSNELRTRLLQIEGVSDARIVGLYEREVKVDIDPFRMYASKVTVEEVAQAVRSNVFEYPAGKITEGKREYLVRATTGIKTASDLGQIRFPTAGSRAGFRMSDIASVYMGVKDRTSFFHSDGNHAIGIFINKSGNTGSLNAASSISESLVQIKEAFKNDLVVEVIQDGSTEIRNSIIDLIVSILIGICATFIALPPVFKRLRLSIITIMSIPIAMILVFLFMHLLRISINLISLSGVAIGVGMIVDNCIVVLENIASNCCRKPEEIAARTWEMISATFGSTATHVLVFVPILFIPGITGALFREFCITISFLLVTSFFISLSFIPAMYSLFVKKPVLLGNRFFDSIEGSYKRYLGKRMKKPFIPVFLIFASLGAGILFFFMLPKEIVPERDAGILNARFVFKKGLDIDQVSVLAFGIEKKILSIPEVSSVYSEAGYDTSSLKDRGKKNRDTNIVRASIHLEASRARGISEIKRSITDALDGMESISYSVEEPRDIVSKLLGVENTVSFYVQGTDRASITKRVEDAALILLGKGLIFGYTSDTERNSPEIVLSLDKDALAFSGIEASQVLETMQFAIKGVYPASLKTAEKELDINVRYKKEEVDTLDKIESIKIPIENGFIALSAVGKPVTAYTFGELFRIDRKNTVTATLIPAKNKEREAALEIARLRGKDITVSSESALEENLREIAIAFALALVLMYLILGAQFESFSIPLLLFISFPVSACGSFITLFLAGKSLNINSFFGILILLGTTINSVILLVASYGKGGTEKIIEESTGRIKPVFGTVAATVLALIPIAFNPLREGALQSHMAISVLGGLLIGTIVILFSFPVVYNMAFSLKRRSRN